MEQAGAGGRGRKQSLVGVGKNILAGPESGSKDLTFRAGNERQLLAGKSKEIWGQIHRSAGTQWDIP